jgi:hypothetical protein
MNFFNARLASFAICHLKSGHLWLLPHDGRNNNHGAYIR